MKHLAIIGPQSPPAGGMARQTEQLVRLWRAEGYEVTLVVTNAPYRPAWLRSLRGMRALARMLPYVMNLWRAAGKADLFHVMANSGWSWYLFAVPAIHLAHWRGIPTVVNYRGGEAQAFLARDLTRVRYSLNRTQALVVPSGFLHAVFAKIGVYTKVVPNIVDLERFEYQAEKCLPDHTLDPIELFFPRHLETIYGADLALRAVAKLKQDYALIQLKLAGEGPERDKLEQLCRDLDIQESVQFLGPLAPQAMAEAYRAAHIVLNPSRVDNMPNALIEAMACGTPVIAARVGGVPFMLQEGVHALLFEADQVDELVQAVGQLIQQPDLYQRLREQGRLHVLQWSWPEVKQKWLAIYYSITASPAKQE
jgi:L-malate glycosyltransferase